MEILGSVISLVVPVSTALIIILLLCVERQQRKRNVEMTRGQKRLFAAIFIVNGCSFAAMLVAGELMDWKLSTRFEKNTAAAEASVKLQQGSRIVELEDSEAAAELLRLMRNEPSVSAHHSHPLSKVYVTVHDDQPYTYSLARDSENKTEFWIQDESWEGYPDSGTPTMRQISSASLRRFLEERDFEIED
jgi:hypothetical protein